MSLLISLCGSALFCWFLCSLIYPILRRSEIIDHPNQRSSHNHPTVRGGGVAIVTTVILGTMILWILSREPLLPAFGCAALILATVSFFDDLSSVSPAVRFGCHIAAAVSVLFVIDRLPLGIELSASLIFRLPKVLLLSILFLWLAGYTNAFNFMDGINGIAAGQAFVTAVGIALMAGLVSGDWNSPPVLFSLVVAGSALGFLPHNFPHAKMFMGDVSSAPLGFLLAALTLWCAMKYGWFLLTPLGLLHANFVLDTGVTLVRRIWRGERWFDAHREHFYQRLVRAGKSHTFVTLSEMGLQLIVLSLMVLYLYVGTSARLGLIALVILLWLGFLAYSEVQFRRQGAKQAPGSRALGGIHIPKSFVDS